MRTRSGARTALAIVAWLFAGCIIVQIFLAGLGVFDGPDAFMTHRQFGYTFGWLTLVMVVIALVGRLPRRLVGLTLLALGQMALQSILILFREDMPAVAALHPVNGVLLLLVAITIGRLAWAGRTQEAPEPALTPSEAAS